MLVTATLQNGISGYGEASPADYVTGEDTAGLLRSVQESAGGLVGEHAGRIRHWNRRLHELLPGSPTARSAVEMALLDAWCRTLGAPMHLWFGGAVMEVRTDLTIPICEPGCAAQLARDAAAGGYSSLKVKVGVADAEQDLQRVLAVQQGAPEAGIRLDANQAFDPPGALLFVRNCLDRAVRVEIMEQPTPAEDLDALQAVTRESPVPVIADESVLSPADALQIVRRGAAHGINIKIAKAGLLGALEIISIAQAAGLRLMLGCMLESLPGIGAAVHLACGTGAFDYLDLDGHTLIGLTPGTEPFSQRGDRLNVSRCGAGLGWRAEHLPDAS